MKTNSLSPQEPVTISRRDLLKDGTAAGGLLLVSHVLPLPFRQAHAESTVPVVAQDNVVWSMCSVNCGSRYALRMHVRDDEMYWVETDHTSDDQYGDHQVLACLRGRSIRCRMNHPDRLNYPMKRVGKRSEGKFQRISWDEALDTLSANLKRIVKDYGNEAVFIHYSSGITGDNFCRLSFRLAGHQANELLWRIAWPVRYLQHRADCRRHALHLRQQ